MSTMGLNSPFVEAAAKQFQETSVGTLALLTTTVLLTVTYAFTKLLCSSPGVNARHNLHHATLAAIADCRMAMTLPWLLDWLRLEPWLVKVCARHRASGLHLTCRLIIYFVLYYFTSDCLHSSTSYSYSWLSRLDFFYKKPTTFSFILHLIDFYCIDWWFILVTFSFYDKNFVAIKKS